MLDYFEKMMHLLKIDFFKYIDLYAVVVVYLVDKIIIRYLS